MMSQRRSPYGVWIRQNWFPAWVVAFAVLLGLVQIWIHWAFRLSFVVGGALAAISIGSLHGFVLAVLHFRGPLADMRFRWRTRGVDRAARQHPPKWATPPE